MNKGMLEVYLQSATGLKNKDFFSKMDPYAILTYRGQYFQSIVAKKQGSTPIWNQKFLFMAEEGDGQMFIKLYDKDRFTGDDFIGSVKVPLDRVFSEFMCPLETYDVILPSGKVKGAVQLALTFTPKLNTGNILVSNNINPKMEDAVYVLRGAPGDNAAALRSIAEGARSVQGRQALAELDAVPLLLSHLQVRMQNKDESMLLLLRALRNLCAGEPQNQDAFVGSAGMEVAVSLARTCHQELVEGTDSWGELVETGKFWLDSVKALLQMLGNVAGRGEQAQAAVWEALFPDSMIDLACVSTGAVRGPLTMVLYTCCRSSGDRRLQLAQGKGASLLALLLRDSELSADSTNQWLTLLVEALCVKDEHFGLLFRHLGPTVGDQVFSSEQAVLLSMIYLVLDERNEGLSGTEKLEWNAMSDLVDIIEQAAVSIGSTSPIKENSLWPTGLPGSDVLGFSLLLGRLLCSHPGTHLELSRRLVEICLEMLRALGPPDMIKKAMESNANEAGSSNGGKEVSIRFPTYNVYRGYRRDVLSVVANLSFRNYHVQELVRESGGLLLVLQQCVVDEGNPYLREWGLWAVRNLTEENEQNVKELSNLELKKSVNTEEILKAGFKVEVDNETRRPKLVNLAASDSQKS